MGRPRSYVHRVIKIYTLRKGARCTKHDIHFSVRYIYETDKPTIRTEFCRLCEQEKVNHGS